MAEGQPKGTPEHTGPVTINLNASRGEETKPAERQAETVLSAVESVAISAEHFAKDHPDQAEKLRAEARAEERERVAALQSAFPTELDAEFLTTAINSGWSLEKAKAEHHDVLAERMKEAATTAAKQETATRVPGFASSDSTGPDDDEPFRQEYRQNMAIHHRLGVTEEQYVKSRRISAGREILHAPQFSAGNGESK